MTKWKLKALAAAVSLAVAGPALAAIDASSTGNGELFFSIWDDASQTSYTRDLAFNLNEFATGNTAGGTAGTTNPGFTAVYAADATFTTWLTTTVAAANLGSLRWNVAGMDSQGLAGASNNRYLTTAASTPTPPPSTTLLNGWNDAADNYIVGVNSGPWVSGSHAPVDGSSVISSSDNANGYANSASWGDKWSGKASFSNAAAIGQSLFFYLLFGGATTSAAPGVDQFDNANGAFTWTLASDGTLSYAQSAAVIPIPGAVWLLGSGLLGLAAVARRRKQAAGAPSNLAAFA